MFRIEKKEYLAPNIVLMDVDAPRIAKNALPGQFLIVRVDEEGERVPLTICDYDAEAGTVQIVFQVVGAESYRMAALEVGDSFADFVGPLGRPSDLCELPLEELRAMKLCFIAGGVGTAPVYAQLKWLKSQGVTADCIQGARTKDILIMEKEMSEVSNLYICTDDGSYGKLEIPTIVSMNPIMVDGTGMCGACRLVVGDEVKFACVDGPEFDGHLVDFEQAMQRMTLYKTEEGRLYLEAKEGDSHHGGCGHCG